MPEKAKLQDSFQKRDKAGQDARLAAMAKINNSVLNADLVTVTTDALAKQVRSINKNAFVIPNSLDNNMPLKEESSHCHENVNIVYLSGTATHDRDFEECANALVEVLKTHSNVLLHIVGQLTLPDTLEQHAQLVRHDFMPHEEMLKFLSSMHINLAPLEIGNEFTECKSELKIFEAAYYAIPTVASSTDAFSSTIKHNHNGMLAKNTTEWLSSINLLVENSEFRQKLGESAKTSIAVTHSATFVAAKLHTLYKFLLANKEVSLMEFTPTDLYEFALNNKDIRSDIIQDCGLLNEVDYLDMYPDALGKNCIEHFTNIGAREGRKASKHFSSWWYDLSNGKYNANLDSYHPIIHALFLLNPVAVYSRHPLKLLNK